VWVWIEKEQQRFVTAQRHLIIIGGVSLDAVSHEESVRAGGDEGMTRSHNLKAQETECTQQGCSIVTTLVKTDEHVIDLQLLFCEFQQKSKTVFTALRQSSRGDFNIKVPSFQRRPPDTVLAFRAPGLKQQESYSAVGRGRLLENQQLSIRIE